MSWNVEGDYLEEVLVKVPDDYKCKTDACSSLGVGRNNSPDSKSFALPEDFP